MSNADIPNPERIEILSDSQLPWQPVVGEETLSLLTNLSLPQATSDTLRNEALSVLAKCAPPTVAAAQETGLVVGYVQSGKTMSFTTVAALARDNGYAIVIVIAGTSIHLTEQSRQRLRRDLRIDERDDRSWRLFHNPREREQDHNRINQTLADWHDSEVPTEERTTILITVMKHHGHLAHLINVLSQVDLDDLPVLIIDDEADQAGLNNLINEGDESTTYQRLCSLKNIVPKHTFLQYTATPQGPLLINLIDVLSPDFAVTLTPGSEYTGGQQFFLNTAPAIRIIPPQDISSNNNQLQGPPASLLEALRIFYLGVASGMIRDQARGNRSMMVHPTQRTGGHAMFHSWVTTIRGAWLQVLESDDLEDCNTLLDAFRDSYNDLVTSVPDLEPFDQLVGRLRQAIRRTELWLVNRSGGATPQIDWRAAYSHILVGGQALDRGFTVEGLTVTYMPRGVGARRADTIQQRARFFGYKRTYLGYCRVFLEQAVADSFSRYLQHERDIRQQLEKVASEGRSLDDLRRVFLLPQGLFATRDSIIDVNYVRARVNQGWFYPRAPHDAPNDGDDNRELVSTFLNELDLEEDEGSDDRTEIQRHYVVHEVSLQDVYEQLLLNLRYSRLTDAQNLLGILVIIRDVLRDSPDSLCTIYQMSMGEPRERRLNDREQIPNLFQGAYPVNPPDQRGSIYPGDREIHDVERITIQVHNLNLIDRSTNRTIFEDIATVAIYIPPDLTGDVIIQDQGGNDGYTDD